MDRVELEVLLVRNAITLALEILADEDSPVVYATPEMLAPLTMKSKDSVRTVLGIMQRRGEIERFVGRGGRRKMTVLMDRPGAAEYVNERKVCR